ncbi:hypothetical protein PENTCL1PPCAC_22499 [Pristionchus entomophagus]|uniref:Uncharacterized protein n=1 Tax=Pristionchus entomophagus TaxID=358040 RepID=A0AAV5U1L8_9BILA|nr:hypothetical protein PENTCL1PPCAC_22499 [Pristionchus entomophagus]
METHETTEKPPMFRKPKKKIEVRKKNHDEDYDDFDGAKKFEDVKELQKSRERKNGLNSLESAVGKERAAQISSGEGFSMGSGGLVLTGQQRAKLEAAGIEAGMREQFEKETMLRDEDEELRKYIEAGIVGDKKQSESSSGPTHRPQETEILMRAAAKMAGVRSNEEKELLSNQMLAGIPEVNLGINARMSNIVATEAKKKELLEKAMRKAAGLPEPEPKEEPDKKRRRGNFQPRR